jgi:hypothetical protein
MKLSEQIGTMPSRRPIASCAKHRASSTARRKPVVRWRAANEHFRRADDAQCGQQLRLADAGAAAAPGRSQRPGRTHRLRGRKPLHAVDSYVFDLQARADRLVSENLGNQLDYDRKEGEAKNATLWFGGAPIFYTPLASFPLNNQPRSGILHPNYSTSTRSRSGFHRALLLEHRAELRPDAVPALHVQARLPARCRGALPGAQLPGAGRLEYMPNDEMKDRSAMPTVSNTSRPGTRTSRRQVNWNGVSDDFYWQDMSSRLLQTSQVQLRQQVSWAMRRRRGCRPACRSCATRRCSSIRANPKRPYFLEPQLNMSATNRMC